MIDCTISVYWKESYVAHCTAKHTTTTTTATTKLLHVITYITCENEKNCLQKP